MFITSYTKDPPDTVKLKEREVISSFPVGKKRLRVKGKQCNPPDFLSVSRCPCQLLLTIKIKAFCTNTQKKDLPWGDRTRTAGQGSCWNTGHLLIELTED